MKQEAIRTCCLLNVGYVLDTDLQSHCEEGMLIGIRPATGSYENSTSKLPSPLWNLAALTLDRIVRTELRGHESFDIKGPQAYQGEKLNGRSRR